MPEDDRRRWNERWRSREVESVPSRFLTDRVGLLPDTGRALDVAGGMGRHAFWLAERGLEVTLVDVADAAIAHVSGEARRRGLPITARRRDLPGDALPEGPVDVVLIHHFLAPEVVETAPQLLTPGGVLLWCQPTVHNLERHERPSRRWLVEPGAGAALAASLGDAMEVIECEEGWTADDRHELHLVLRRPAPQGSAPVTSSPTAPPR